MLPEAAADNDCRLSVRHFVKWGESTAANQGRGLFDEELRCDEVDADRLRVAAGVSFARGDGIFVSSR